MRVKAGKPPRKRKKKVAAHNVTRRDDRGSGSKGGRRRNSKGTGVSRKVTKRVWKAKAKEMPSRNGKKRPLEVPSPGQSSVGGMSVVPPSLPVPIASFTI